MFARLDHNVHLEVRRQVPVQLHSDHEADQRRHSAVRNRGSELHFDQVWLSYWNTGGAENLQFFECVWVLWVVNMPDHIKYF